MQPLIGRKDRIVKQKQIYKILIKIIIVKGIICDLYYQSNGEEKLLHC